jgi:hypothetical protein
MTEPTESPIEIIKHAVDQVISHPRSTHADIEAICILHEALATLMRLEYLERQQTTESPQR